MRNQKLIIGAAVLTLLLAGCAQGSQTDSAPSGNAAANVTPQGGEGANGASATDKTGGGLFSDNERQMMTTFQALIAVDKQAGLAITKEQAAKLLPQVEKSVQAGALTSEDKLVLEGVLTAEQTSFYAEQANRGGQRGGQGRRPDGSGGQGPTPAGQQGQGPQGQGQRGQGMPGRGQNGGQPGMPAPSGSPSPDGSLQPGNGTQQGGNFQRPNVESQLVELLKGKING